MPIVASVRLRYVPKDYWFDPNGIEVHEGDHVVVQTERGREIGLCVASGMDVKYEELKAPLKPILRVATDEDFARIDSMADTTKQAMRRFRELIKTHDLDMKPVEVEFMFDMSHATFYFTADDRIDFRSLVRDLAAEFHVRVDMRQIGVRDEARAIGGLGHCGQELCCTRMGGDFQPVSIRMAKEQDLPLNPAKISGLCGRLMCCLRYEFEAYKDFKSRSPKKNALIDTPLGTAKVVEFDTPRERVRVRFEDGKSMDIPVSAMDTGDKVAREGENIRPCHISQEKFDQIIEELNEDKNLAMMGDKLFSDDPDLADREAQAGTVERTQRRRRRSGSGSGSSSGSRSSEGRQQSGRSRSSRSSRDEQPAQRTERRRRRSVAVGDASHAGSERSNNEGKGAASSSSSSGQGASPRPRRRRTQRSGDGAQRQGQQRSSTSVSSAAPAGRPRPGQHSSTVSGDAARSQRNSDSSSADASQAARKRRRRGKRGGRGRNGKGGAADSGTSSGGSAPGGE